MRFAVILIVALSSGCIAWAQDEAPQLTAIAKVLIRSPDPFELARYYEALGFVEQRRGKTSITFHLEGNIGALEVLKMDANTQPSEPKTSRTQQGVVAIFETTEQAALVERAKAAGAKLVEQWDAPDRPISVYYIADPENNILGFASRHHNPNIKTP